MNIIIDPHMFELEDEEEIRNNIPFFQTLIFLCKSGRIRIFLYKELFEKMLAREVVPFPIRLGRIKDASLLNSLKQLNTTFVSIVMNRISSIDIEQCDGEQNFSIETADPDDETVLLNDASYYELLNVLLTSCYTIDDSLSQVIVTGNIANGICVGKCFSLICNCSVKAFKKEFCFNSIELYETDRDKSFIFLDNMAASKQLHYVQSPEIERGSHHNKLQFNSEFDTYEGLSRINKAVISRLRYFGLKKVIFGEFHEDTSKPKGTIIVHDVQKTESHDIIKGWLFAETNFKNHVDLYFPRNVGECLSKYLEGEFDKVSVERLVDTLSLVI